MQDEKTYHAFVKGKKIKKLTTHLDRVGIGFKTEECNSGDRSTRFNMGLTGKQVLMLTGSNFFKKNKIILAVS